MAEHEPTTNITPDAFRQASQMENALQNMERTKRHLDRGDGFIFLWASQPFNNPLNDPERHTVPVTEELLTGLSKCAFARYIDLVEGGERVLADDILSQYQARWHAMNASPKESDER